MKYLGKIIDSNDLTNKQYVDGKVGEVNSSLASLTTRVNTAEDNIQMAESDIESLQTDSTTLKSDMSSVKTAVKTLQDTYVPNTTKVNGKALNKDIILTASDVGALPDTYKSVFIVNLKYDDSDNLTGADKTFEEIVEAYNKGLSIYAIGTFLSIFWQLFQITSEGVAFTTTFTIGQDQQCSSIMVLCTKDNVWSTTGTTVVPTSRTINGKSLENNVALTASDVSALPITGGTLTGNLKVGSSNIGTNGHLQGTWLQGTASNHLTTAATKIAVQDVNGWIYHRTATELLSDIGAMPRTATLTATDDGNGDVTLSFGG